MKAPDVVDLLGIGAVRNRFGIAPGDLDLLREWIREAGIRWGVDADHRAATGLPALDENTWRFGLDRLLLGYALDDATNLFGGALPCLTVEGTTARLLGALVELLEVLFEWRKRLAEPRTPVEWGHELAELLAATIADDPATADQVQGLAAALDDVAERAATAGFDAPIALDAFRTQLDGELRRRATTHGFLSRGVCFCELVPMRTIPFRVVCLVGMSDGVFPRTERPLGFDLMARHPRPGDRSAREDDRYLFLEALMAARERLIVTYVGQGIRDNDVRPPSVVVSELLDALDETFCTDGEAGVKQLVEVVHPLQAFSPRYFGAEPESGLFSFRVAERRAAEALLADPSPPAPFVAAPLPSVPSQEIRLDDLVEFFRRPARWFARRQLDLPPQRGDPSAREPRADRSRRARALVDRESHRREPAPRSGDRDRGRDRTPARRREPPSGRARRPLLPPDSPRGRRDLRGRRAIPQLRRGRCDRARPGRAGCPRRRSDREPPHERPRPRPLLARREPPGHPWWVRHVFLCLLSPAGIAPVTTVVGRAAKVGDPTAVRFGPLADAEAIAGDLVDLYRAGQREPLPLFSDASREFAEEYRKSRNESAALAAAAQLEERRTGHEARIRDADVELLFRGRDRLAPSAGAGRPGVRGGRAALLPTAARARGGGLKPLEPLTLEGSKPLEPLTLPLSGTVVVEASAGTGKTFTLSNLYLRLIVEAGREVDGILVVTYTNAATAELRDRVRRRLRAALIALRGGPAEDDFLAAFAASRARSRRHRDRPPPTGGRTSWLRRGPRSSRSTASASACSTRTPSRASAASTPSSSPISGRSAARSSRTIW
jgi:exodeoxyribonuclease V gamma subunit